MGIASPGLRRGRNDSENGFTRFPCRRASLPLPSADVTGYIRRNEPAASAGAEADAEYENPHGDSARTGPREASNVANGTRGSPARDSGAWFSVASAAGRPGGRAMSSADTAGPQVRRRRKHQGWLGSLYRRFVWPLLPALMFVAIIAVWWLAVALTNVPDYLLPSPGAVLPAMVNSGRSIWNNSLVTIEEIVLGFLLSVVTAIPLGLLIALSPVAKRMLYPLLVFIQLVPKIAIAPLFVVWIGFGPTSKVMLTLLLTFFPLLLAIIAGFQILDPRFLHLTKSMGATFWQTFRYLRFPSALPVIFGGLKTSATIAATAAIVAEFVGANKGLGYLLLQATGRLDTTLVFAILFVMTIIGLALNSAVEVLEYVITPWRRGRSAN
jgi:NitT/TauT family transport system permease protein